MSNRTPTRLFIIMSTPGFISSVYGPVYRSHTLIPTRKIVSGSSTISTVPSNETPRSVS